MPLEELEKRLYKPGDKEEEIPIRRSPKADVRPAPAPGARWGKTERIPEEPDFPSYAEIAPPPEIRTRFKKFILPALIIIAVSAGAVFLFVKLMGASPVTMVVTGPQEIKAGDAAQYKIVIENLSRTGIERASLSLRLGLGVVSLDSEDRVIRREMQETILPGAVAQEEFTIYFLGAVGDEREAEITLKYRMPGIASELARTHKIAVKINAPAVSLILGAPNQVISATNFVFGVDWKNLSDIDLGNFGVEMSFPENFVLVDSEPRSEEERIWKFGELPSQTDGTLSIVGRIDAPAWQTRKFGAEMKTKVRGDIIVLVRADDEINVIENPLALAMSIKGASVYNASPGEALEYKLTFKNDFKETLRDVVAVVKLKGRMFDVASVSSDGEYDSRDFTITFDGGNTPQLLFLDPQESGSVVFTVKLLPDFPGDLENNVIVAEAEMTSSTKPRHVGLEGLVRATTSIESKVNALFSFDAKVFRRDPVLNISGSGPWPMRQNQTTQFIVRWLIRGRGNALSNVIFKTILPENVSYGGMIGGNTSGTQIVVNPRTREIEWQIARFGAYQSREWIFRINVTPSAAQVGSKIMLMNEITGKALDNFTNEELHVVSLGRYSAELDDATIEDPFSEGRVQP